jgi:hypothetical protein
MSTITLICTVHKEKGACTISELYKIIERINPDVIFEEMSPSTYNNYYVDMIWKKLESDTINEYLKKRQIKHIPVDYDDIPKTFATDNLPAHQEVERRSYTYRNLCDYHSSCVFQYGFKYLNSDLCSEVQSKLHTEIIEALQEIGNKNLTQRNQTFNDIDDKREHEMIRNIYKYCSENEFENGLFLIGGGHRFSIIKKIQEYIKNEELKINWNYSDYDNIL